MESILTQHQKVPALREAFISGLAKDAARFHHENPDIKDASIAKHLANATKKLPAVAAKPGAHLKDDELKSFQRGEELYTTKAACFGCHGEDGKGLPDLGPPLSPSEWVTGDPARLAKILLHGMAGPLKVNGLLYQPVAAMPAVKDNLNDQELADVMTYVRNNWTNKTAPVTADFVKKVRADTADRTAEYSAEELQP